MFQRFVETSAHVQSFAIRENIYLLSDRRIQVFDIFGHVVATASQDKSLALWDKETLEPNNVKKNAHKKAFVIVGAWNAHILTVSFPCGEIKVWDRTTLKEKAALPIAPCLSGQTYLQRSNLYLSSRAIDGIDYADIGTIVI